MTKTDDGILDSSVFSVGDRRTFVGACKMGVVSGCLVVVMILSSHTQLTSSSALVARNCRAARTPVMMNSTTETAEAKP